jgi:O-antigen/teichoic acid export membrane protein
LLAGGISLLEADAELAATLWLAVPVLLARGLVTINLAAHRGALRVLRYNLVECAHNLASFVCAWLLVTCGGMGAAGLMLGMLIGACLALLPDLLMMLRGLARPDPAIVREMGAFGGPLVVCYAMNAAQSYGDRLFLERLSGADAVGIYAVAGGIVDRAVTLVFMAVTLGAFPLAVDAVERDGPAGGRRQLLANATALLALGVPAAAGIACLAEPIATVLVGPEFRAGVIGLIPWLALLSLLRGITIHYLDHALHLGERTDLFLYTIGPAALLSLLLNALLIPLFGLAGALAAAFAAQLLALVCTAVIGRRVFPIGFPWAQAIRVAIATAVMVGVLEHLSIPDDVVGIVLAIVAGLLAYTVTALLLDTGGARRWLVDAVQRGLAQRRERLPAV